MTTFNQLLGTTSNDSSLTIKQRYKLLSTRVHPDKEGSKVLMQLVHQAYEKISIGKGEHQLILPTSASFKKCEALGRKLQQVKNERNELVLLNKSLKVKLYQTQNSLNTKEDFVINADFIKKVAQLEGENLLLKNARDQLLSQIGAIPAEKKLTAEIRAVLSESDVLATERVRNSGSKSTGTLLYTRKFWLSAVSVIGIITIEGKQVNWRLFLGWLSEMPSEPSPSVVRFKTVESNINIDEKPLS
ncbi:J domain-containing protein [Candidatus Enterovibrio escicola]|uniref:J domain-containing protein n=1 Tax=Candidatus Enterovibrio escicola TaxID=1927127 RepID=UPI0012381AE2|nr:J domain-containing protein [Candidatus Enterovibrio escacola]